MSIFLSIIFGFAGFINLFSSDATKGLMMFTISALFCIAHYLRRIDLYIRYGDGNDGSEKWRG